MLICFFFFLSFVEDVDETVGKGSSVIDVNPPRGTRDFPPDDMRLRNWLFQNFREVYIGCKIANILR